MKKYLILLTALVIAATLTVSPASAAVETLDLGWNAAPEQPEAFDALPAPEADSATKVAYTDDNIVGGSIYYNPQTGAIVDCDSTVMTAVIPSEIDGVTITRIDARAFKGKKIMEVGIPSTVTYIGDSAFESADLHSLFVPDSVESIGKYAFRYNSSLKTAEIAGKTFLDRETFCGCSMLESVKIPNIVSIGESAFLNCSSLYDVTLPDTIETIPRSCFGHTNSLKSFKFPANVKVIGDYAFRASGLNGKLVIPDTVTELGIEAFGECASLNEIEIPGSIKVIPEKAFNECDNVITLIINEGVTSINNSAFGIFDAIKTVYLPKSLKYIQERAFSAHSYPYSHVETIYYGGCEELWNKILIGSSNYVLIGQSTVQYKGHSYALTFDDDFHWLECECGAISGEKSPHTPDGSGVCTVCGHGKQPEHVHTETYGTDTHVHWTKCDVCGESWGVEEHVLGEDGICEICRFKPEQESTGSGIRGDLNGDGNVTVSDGVTMQRILAGLE